MNIIKNIYVENRKLFGIIIKINLIDQSISKLYSLSNLILKINYVKVTSI